MYNLVCGKLKCTERDKCSGDCGNCEHTEDLEQCIYCENHDTCTIRSKFRIAFRDYYRHLGGFYNEKSWKICLLVRV